MSINGNPNADFEIGLFRRFVMDKVFGPLVQHDHDRFIVFVLDRERVAGHSSDGSEDRIAMGIQQPDEQNNGQKKRN